MGTMLVQCWLIIWPSAGPALCVCLTFAGLSFRVTCINKPLCRWWTVAGLMLCNMPREHIDTLTPCRFWYWINIDLALGRSPMYTVKFYSIHTLTRWYNHYFVKAIPCIQTDRYFFDIKKSHYRLICHICMFTCYFVCMRNFIVPFINNVFLHFVCSWKSYNVS